MDCGQRRPDPHILGSGPGQRRKWVSDGQGQDQDGDAARPHPPQAAGRDETTRGSATTRMDSRRRVATAVLTVATVAWAVGRGTGDSAPPAASIEHVHGLGVNPANGLLYAAAHNGVFQLPANGPASRVGDGQQDTMGFTITGNDHFLASGHPAPGRGGPRHLGLIESTNGGLTWRSLSLGGAADFHALRYRHDTVYGYNSVNGQLMVSRDRTAWQTRATITVQDFAVSPASPDTLLATSQQGPLRSTDGGRTWTRTGGPPVALVDWEREDRLWGVTTDGSLLLSTDGGTVWTPAGRLAAAETAFAAHGQDLYAAVHERGIFHSPDAGTTWTQIYP
jgi:hypothetical protein